jgi:lysophospholipase L1-like esterase
MTKMKKLLITALFLASLNLQADQTENVPLETQLPKVLIIGDSISIGYTPYVTKMLQGKVIIKHNKGNAQYTGTGLQKLDEWVGDTKWDVIHFNWGLWDIYGWRYAKEDRSVSAYEQRLDSLARRLKKTGAKLIWCTTTPVCPEAEKTMLKRFASEVRITPVTERQYLDAALRVMKKYQIEVNDLHTLMDPKRAQYALGDNDVHYTADGYKMLAKQVADTIQSILKANPH